MFKPSKVLFVTVLTAALVVPIARADLVFEQSTIELHPAIGDEKAVAHYKYQNKGDKPVAIKNVSTSCGCTAATAGGKTSAAPGEKGEVTATFSVGDRIGKQEKVITVVTDDPKQPVTQLHLTVLIPRAMEVTPTLLFWQANESPKPKTMTAKAGKDVSIKSVDVSSSNPDFTAKVGPGPSPGEYQITVEPKATNKAIDSRLTVKSILGDGKTQNAYATARVMPPPPTPAQSPSGQTQAGPTPAGATSPPPVQSKVNACSLLTSDEIKSVQGEPLKEPKGSASSVNGLVSSQCYFGLPTASNSISLTLTGRGEGGDAGSPKEYWDKAFHRESKEEEKERGEENEKARPPKKIDGVGDEAYWSGNRVGGALYVLKGDNIIRISVGGAGDEAAKIDKSKKLAQMVLKRL